jgi:hypothetical protein
MGLPEGAIPDMNTLKAFVINGREIGETFYFVWCYDGTWTTTTCKLNKRSYIEDYSVRNISTDFNPNRTVLAAADVSHVFGEQPRNGFCLFTNYWLAHGHCVRMQHASSKPQLI